MRPSFLSLYVQNVESGGLWAITSVEFEFELSGAVTPRVDVLTYTYRNMYLVDKYSLDAVRMVLEIIFVLSHTAYFAHDVRRSIHAAPSVNVQRFLNFKFAKHTLGWALIVIWIVVTVTTLNNRTNYTKFAIGKETLFMVMNFMQTVFDIVQVYAFYKALAAVYGLMLGIGLIGYLEFHEGLSTITQTLRNSMTQVAHFLVAFALIVLLFSAAALYIFGASSTNFSDFGASLTTILRLVLSDYGKAQHGVVASLISTEPCFLLA